MCYEQRKQREAEIGSMRHYSSPNTHFDIRMCWNVRLHFMNLMIRTKAFTLKDEAEIEI